MHKAGVGIRQISRLLSISRNTVRRVIKGEEQSHRKSRYEDLLPLVREHFHFCKGNAVRIHEFLGEKYGVDIPYSSLTRLIRELELREEKKKGRVGRYCFGPGEEAQHDTSPHRLILGDKKITAQCASLTLGYCRKVFIQYYPQLHVLRQRSFSPKRSSIWPVHVQDVLSTTPALSLHRAADRMLLLPRR